MRKSDLFRDGMIAALAVVAVHDQETTWREIVATQPDLVEYARADSEVWGWAGFERYIGKRKIRKPAADMPGQPVEIEMNPSRHTLEAPRTFVPHVGWRYR